MTGRPAAVRRGSGPCRSDRSGGRRRVRPRARSGAVRSGGPLGEHARRGDHGDGIAGDNTGTQITATASCAAGEVLLGGGGDVTTNGVGNLKRRTVLASSYPSSTTTWTVVGVVTDSNLAATQTMSVTAFALCSL